MDAITASSVLTNSFTNFTIDVGSTLFYDETYTIGRNVGTLVADFIDLDPKKLNVI